MGWLLCQLAPVVPECASLLSSSTGWKYGYREPGGAARWGLHPAGLCWVLPGCRLHPHAPGRCRTPSEPSTSPVLLIMAMRASLLNSQGDQWSFFSPAFTLLRGAAGFAIPPSRRSHPGAVRGGSRFAMIYTRPSAPKLHAGAWQSGAGGLVALPWPWGQRCGANTDPWQGTWLLPAAGSWAPGQLQPLLSKHFGAKCRKRAPTGRGHLGGSVGAVQAVQGVLSSPAGRRRGQPSVLPCVPAMLCDGFFPVLAARGDSRQA